MLVSRLEKVTPESLEPVEELAVSGFGAQLGHMSKNAHAAAYNVTRATAGGAETHRAIVTRGYVIGAAAGALAAYLACRLRK